MNLALGLVALIPAMIGPLPGPAHGHALLARLCDGGSLEIPLPDKAPDTPAPCHQKGCHAGCSRKRA